MLNAICHNCFEFVFPGYWHFENGVTRVSEHVSPSPLDLGLGDWGPGLDNKCLPSSLLKTACGNSKNSSTFCFARESPFRSRDVKDLLFVSVSLPWLPGWRDLNI